MFMSLVIFILYFIVEKFVWRLNLIIIENTNIYLRNKFIAF